ncbi:MAG: tetratricopeptide repeat protein [Candidatus Latescibacteria bacterium]|nr:tetratricopeptide repeat protein [Candidatus Latescibacterota bacterium]NIT38266.1 tetratricopeptide repeat protein [Candidatus Latescibacterota bacterium]
MFVCVLSCAARHSRLPSPELVEQVNYQRARAAQLLNQGDFQTALNILEDVNSRMPNDAWTLGLLGWAQWKTGSFKEAVGNFEESLRRDYLNHLTHLRFAQMLIEQGKIGRALTEFELAVKYGSSDPLAHYNYGLALYKTGRKEEALIEWQQAYDLDRSDPKYAEAMGMGLTGTDDRRALYYFEKANSLGVEGPSFHHNFALLLQRLGDHDRAEREFQRALEKDPDNASYRFGLAAFYTNAGSYEKALPIWKGLVEQSPGDLSYRIHFARTLLELGRFQEAISVLEPIEAGQGMDGETPKTIAIGEAGTGPVSVDDAFGILAMSYRGLGDLEKANLFIEKALDINSESVEHLNNYGVILAERGMIDRARIQWQKVLEIEPDNETARQNLSASGR